MSLRKSDFTRGLSHCAKNAGAVLSQPSPSEACMGQWPRVSSGRNQRVPLPGGAVKEEEPGKVCPLIILCQHFPYQETSLLLRSMVLPANLINASHTHWFSHKFCSIDL